ncbi:MAG: sugar phosphate isomerase/epimerase [Eubacteriales bacterium]|nr:sugar phosphate isomerase/epimerase [Eubacteriales bacterium]
MDLSYPAVLDNADALKNVLDAYATTDNYSVHGVFIDINYSGGDPLIFEVSKKRIIQCAQNAKKLNINKMILHTCFFPILTETDMLYDIWCEDSANFLIRIAEQYDMELFIENVLDISPFVLHKLMQKANNERIGVCLDVGHANLTKTPIAEWVRVLHPYIKYFHLSDNNGVFDEHLALGDGNIDFEELGQLIKQYGIKADYTLEVAGLERVLRSIGYLQTKELSYVK